MPLNKSHFRSPLWMLGNFGGLIGGNLQTQLPVILRFVYLKSESVSIPTPDGDLLFGDYYIAKNSDQKSIMILVHGLEGNSKQAFMTGFAKKVLHNGVNGKSTDVLAWNLRGCGKKDNSTEKLYYGGSTADYDAVVTWAESKGYTHIYLASYSLGGNIMLRWLGDQGAAARARGVKSACTASATLDLASCTQKLDRWYNFLYRLFFISQMKWRIFKKSRRFPGKIDMSNFNRVYSFEAYDKYFSAPLNGFASLEDLYAASSARFVLHQVTVPCLIVDAENDPFLSEACVPTVFAETSTKITLDITQSGGHVGYLSNQYSWWLDQRFLDFFNQHA